MEKYPEIGQNFFQKRLAIRSNTWYIIIIKRKNFKKKKEIKKMFKMFTFAEVVKYAQTLGYSQEDIEI